MENRNYNKLYSLEMFEYFHLVCEPNYKETYTRVPGGWVRDVVTISVNNSCTTSVFIPFVDKILPKQ